MLRAAGIAASAKAKAVKNRPMTSIEGDDRDLRILMQGDVARIFLA
jgi:hypothetical protein